MLIRSLRYGITCLLLTGCSSTGLERPPIGQAIGTVFPEHYCPNDVLYADYHVILPESPCDAYPGHACPDATPPRVTMIATPEDFPRRGGLALADRVGFTPSGDAVDVSFQVDPDPYATTYPARRQDGSHFAVVRVLHSNVVQARRFTGTIDVDVETPVRCVDGHPRWGQTVVPWPDGYTYNMQPVRICNLSTIPLRLNLNSPSGVTPDLFLEAGACADTATPEFNIPSALSVGVSVPAIDPTLTCSPLQGHPAGVPVIKTRVTLGCPPH